jgi:hypothetical protein
MRASQIDDPLYLPDEDDYDMPAPMQPVRLQYVTHPTERALLVDTMERLGLVHAWVGQTLYALNECDSSALRLAAREQLHAERQEQNDDRVMHRAQSMLVALVYDQAPNALRSALHEPQKPAKPSAAVDQFAREMRAQADADLAAFGVDMKARIAQRLAEYDAA